MYEKNGYIPKPEIYEEADMNKNKPDLLSVYVSLFRVRFPRSIHGNLGPTKLIHQEQGNTYLKLGRFIFTHASLHILGLRI